MEKGLGEKEWGLGGKERGGERLDYSEGKVCLG